MREGDNEMVVYVVSYVPQYSVLVCVLVQILVFVQYCTIQVNDKHMQLLECNQKLHTLQQQDLNNLLLYIR